MHTLALTSAIPIQSGWGWQVFGFQNKNQGVPIVVQWVKNPTSIHKDLGSIPRLTQWIKDLALPQLQYRSQMQLRSRNAGAGAGSHSSDSTPSLGTSLCHKVWP